MCVLCGRDFVAQAHWTDRHLEDRARSSGGDPLEYQRDRRRERVHRAVIVNEVLRHYGLRVQEWSGSKYLVRDGKGRSELVQDLGSLWPAAERLAGRPLDPLDPALHEALAGEIETAKRPVTVVTGFLGSGKTTLLARVLSGPSMRNTAVLVNEFGKVGLDHHLLRRADERTVLLGHGCVCCTTREDLVGALLELLDEEARGSIQPLNRVVIETTGLADPAPILFTVFSHPVLQHHYYVDLVISTVDAVNGELHLDRNPESSKQIAASDVVVLTKTDVAEAGAVDGLYGRIHGINPYARVVEAPFGEVDPAQLLRPPASPAPVREAPVPVDNQHVSRTHSTSLTFDGPVDWAAFGAWFSMLLYARGEEVLRVKGLLDAGGEGPVLLNGVQHVMHPPEHLEEWPDGDRDTRLVFITRGIRSEELLASLEAFRGVIGAGPRLVEADARV